VSKGFPAKLPKSPQSNANQQSRYSRKTEHKQHHRVNDRDDRTHKDEKPYELRSNISERSTTKFKVKTIPAKIKRANKVPGTYKVAAPQLINKTQELKNLASEVNYLYLRASLKFSYYWHPSVFFPLPSSIPHSQPFKMNPHRNVHQL